MQSRHKLQALTILLIAASAISLPGCGKTPAAEEEKTPPAPVKWEQARHLFLEEWREFPGTTVPLPNHAGRISAPIDGLVMSVLHAADGKQITEGQEVQPGDVIAQLDDRAAKADCDRAEASLKSLTEDVLQAESAVRVATIEVNRLRQLSQNLISPVDVKKAEAAHEDAESRLRSARAKVVAGKREVDALEAKLGLYTVRASRRGRLGRILVVPGQALSVGTPVGDIVDVEDQIDVLSYAASSDARLLALGQTARLGGWDAANESGPEGQVVFIADQAEPETGMFAVKTRFPNRQSHLGANVPQAIRVRVRPGKDCLAIPEEASMEDQEPPGVLVAEDIKTSKDEKGKEQQTGTARQLQAKIGVRDRVLHQVEILGLADKEKKWKGNLEEALFIVQKGQGLETGDPVKLEQEDDD
jgi:RND family efflux transporter MFP subunit